MDCERFDKNSMDLLYGELDELSEAATLRHLHHCTRCRGIWGHLRTTRELSQLPQEEPPSGLAARILDAERLAHQSLPLGERFSRTVSVLAGYAMRPQLAMAVLLALMVGSGLIFVRGQPTGSSADGIRVVERGAPSGELPGKRAGSKTLVFSGDTEQQARSSLGDDLEEPDGDLPSRHAQTPISDEENRLRQRAAYADAMTAYQQGRYAEAERLFSEVASAGGEQAASAALHEGHAARNGSGCQRAAAIYDAIASKHLGSTIAAEASWHAASCYRAMGQQSRAIAHYQLLAASGAFADRARQALSELVPPTATAASTATAPSAGTAGKPAGSSPAVAPAALPATATETTPSVTQATSDPQTAKTGGAKPSEAGDPAESDSTSP